MNVEKIYEIGIELARDFVQHAPKKYNEKEFEEYLFDFVVNVVPQKIAKMNGINFFERIALRYVARMSWKEFSKLIGEILSEIPGKDAEKSVEDVLKNIKNYLK